MKIKSLTIENFLIIGNAKIDLDGRGLLLVQGENDDDSSANSNGAGKSSIVDAISWCLYGETARGISGDEVVNETVGKNCVVKVLIEDAGFQYEISRHRKHKSCKNDLYVLVLDKDGEVTDDLSKGTVKLTQEVINKIVGCSYDVFIAAVYSGQEMMPDLPGMTDKQLKMIVEEAAGIERLQSAHEIAISRNKVALAEVVAKQSKLDSNESLIHSGKEDLFSLKEEVIQHEKDKDASLKKYKENLNIYKDKMALLTPKDLDARANAEAELKSVLSELLSGSREEDKATLQKIVSERDWDLRIATKETQQTIDTAKKIKSELDKIEERIGTPCTECGKEYHAEDMEDAKANITTKLKLSLVDLKKYKVNEEEAKERLNIALTAQKTFIDAMIDTSELSERYEALTKLVKDLDEMDKQHTVIYSEISALESLIAEEKARVNPFVKMSFKKESEIDVLKKENELLVGELLSLESKLETTTAAVEVFGRSGVRAHILDTVTPFLNERTAEYLGTLTDGNITASWSTLSMTGKGDLREKFGIAVAKRSGSKSFSGLSGGEKRKVRLSTAMALQDLVASRATKPIEFQLYDEIDDALDVSGLERLMTILDKRGKEKGTVIVISHNDLGAWIDQSITVVNSGGISTIESEL